MILTSGKLKITENKGKGLFFDSIQVGDIVEVKCNISQTLRYGGGSRMVTVYNHTQGTKRSGAPTHIGSGMDKLKWESAE